MSEKHEMYASKHENTIFQKCLKSFQPFPLHYGKHPSRVAHPHLSSRGLTPFWSRRMPHVVSAGGIQWPGVFGCTLTARWTGFLDIAGDNVYVCVCGCVCVNSHCIGSSS